MKNLVLIIDDNEVDRYLLSRQLKETQLEIAIHQASDGQKGLDFFKENYSKKELKEFPPLVVFLDINMPEMDGHEFLKSFESLRGQVGAEPSVIMMFTSSESEIDKSRALSYSFVKDYLVKGQFSAIQLKEKIKAQICA